MKRGHGDVMGTGKNMWGLWVSFLMQLKIKKAVSKKLSDDSKTHNYRCRNFNFNYFYFK